MTIHHHAPHTSTIDRAAIATNAPDAARSKGEILAQTKRRRDEAARLLETLINAKRVSERNLADLRQDDLMTRVRGRSSMDDAIASTRRLIDAFNRVIDELRRTLSDEDLELLEPARA